MQHKFKLKFFRHLLIVLAAFSFISTAYSYDYITDCYLAEQDFVAVKADKFPIISQENLCGIENNSSKGILMSATYSTNINQIDRLFSSLLKKYGKLSHYTDDVIKLLILKMSTEKYVFDVLEHSLEDGFIEKIKSQKPLRMAYYQDKNEYEIYNNEKHIFDFYSLKNKVISIKRSYSEKSELKTLIHESTHAVADMFFQNRGNPYYNNPTSKNRFKLAKTNFLLSIAKKLNLDIKGLTKSEDIYGFLKEKSMLDMLFVLGTTTRYQELPFCMSEKIEQKYLSFAEALKYKDDGLSRARLSRTFEAEIKAANPELTADDMYILATCSRLLYYYPIDQLDAELIVIVPELLMHGISEAKIAEYFGSIMECWNETIHQYASKITLLNV